MVKGYIRKHRSAWIERILSFCTPVLAIVIFPQVSLSQTAQITGRTIDASQAALPGVSITLTNEQTGVTHQATSNEVGHYTLSLLRPGSYRIELQAAGFRRLSRGGVRLDVEQVAQLDFQLEVGDVAESIEVVAAAPVL